jgi:NAD(P)-dependent dehydrogenase (short-subunit alcohol dehydrogenase family)
VQIFDLSGKIAIVTGGNQGIGLGIARGLAMAGANVVIANRRATEGEEAAEALRKEGLNAVSIPTDVRDEHSIAALVSKVMNDFGVIDILVNNAGVTIRKAVEEFSRDDWDYIMDINLKGVFFYCQLVGREMVKRRKGKIINVSSDLCKKAMEEKAVYATSKAGVSHLTRCLALEWAKYNVNVNAIAPGLTITPMNKDLYDKHPEKLEQLIRSLPIGKPCGISDYAGAAIFLASEASNFVVGQTLFVDGGSTLV